MNTDNTGPESLGHLNRRIFYDNTFLPATALNYVQYQHEINMELLVHPYTRGVLSGLEASQTSLQAENTVSISPGAAVLQHPETGTKTFFPVKDPLSVNTSDLGNKVGQQLLLTYTQESRGTISSLDVSVTHSEYDERIPQLIWWDKTETTRPEKPFCVLYVLKSGFVLDTSSEYRQTAFCNTFPVGTVIPFAGADWYENNTIPGWYTCDGQNGTPDLRERFLMGTSTDNLMGSTGGENQFTLQKNQLPQHDHAARCGDNGGHEHSYQAGINVAIVRPGNNTPIDLISGEGIAEASHQTGSVRDHQHAITIEEHGTGWGGAENPQNPIENRPAFYSLRYIMRRS